MSYAKTSGRPESREAKAGIGGLPPAGQVLRPIYRPCRHDVPRDLLLPVPRIRLTDRLPVAAAGPWCPATQCECGSGPPALAGTPNAEYVLADHRAPGSPVAHR